MAIRLLRRARQHLATVWLLGNSAIVLLWPASPMMWLPFTCLAMLVWPVAAVSLLIASLAWGVERRRRLIACATVLLGAAVGWESPTLGPISHVWLRQNDYLERARVALADLPAPPSCGPGWAKVDHSDAPPVRVAFFWFAAHGDVGGIVYDPTGNVATGRQDWLYGAAAWHMFGPWYRFVN